MQTDVQLSCPGFHSGQTRHLASGGRRATLLLSRITGTLFLLLGLLAFPQSGFALGQPLYVESTPERDSFRLVHNGTAANIYVDDGDFAGVVRAAHDLQKDIFRTKWLHREP
jgi:hypothetical protein